MLCSGTRRDPTDSTYRGRAVNSRVTGKSNTKSVIQTRAAKKGAPRGRAPSEEASGNMDVEDECPSPHVARLQRSRSTRQVSRVVDTSSDEDQPAESGLDGKQSVDLNQYDTTDPFIDDSDMPVSRGRRMEREPSTPRRSRNHRRPSPEWADIEAEESDDDNEVILKKRSSRRQGKAPEHLPGDRDVGDTSSEARSGRDLVPSVRRRTPTPAPVLLKRSRSHSPEVDRKRLARRSPSCDGASLPKPIAAKSVRRTFASVLVASGSASSSTPAPDQSPLVPSTQYLGDFEYRQPTDIPEQCEVTSQSLQDAALQPFYSDLPRLRSCTFESWNGLDGPGMVSFSQWSINSPDMGYDSCLNAINFTQHGSYIGPARICPTEVRIRTIAGAKSRYYLYTSGRKPALCISCIFTKDSHVLEPPSKGLVQKSITGIFHSQEWERTVGFMGTAFGHTSLRAQLSMDAMQFTTRAHFSKGGSSPSKSSPSKASQGKLSSMFSNIRSPAVAGKANAIRSSFMDTFSLDYDADIPVYDCRSVDLVLERDLDLLHTFPRWEGEIPFGAFTVVAYTVTVFRAEKTNAWTVSYNLHWAMILGVATGPL